jgi:hypothetical protein
MTDFGFKLQLAAGRVDSANGVIYDVTLAKSGVIALGKFIFVDGDGNVTKDPAKARRRLPVYTDDQTLETLMGAFQDAGTRIRTRVNHDDSIEARAGHTQNFRREGDRVIGDLYLLTNFPARDIVLEVAEKTPDLMGMSIDLVPTFEIKGDRAFMRVQELLAVDIVDEGAITPAGMFLNRDRVDTEHNSKTKPLLMAKETPAKETPPAPDPTAMEASIKEMAARCDGLSAKVAALEASHGALAEDHKTLLAKHAALEAAHNTLAGVTKKADGAPAPAPDGMAAVKQIADDLKTLRSEVVEMKKTNAALGMKAGGSEPSGKPGTGPSADPNDKPAPDAPKDYLTLVAEKKKTGMSAGLAHQTAQREQPDLYRKHQESLGVWPKSA